MDVDLCQICGLLASWSNKSWVQSGQTGQRCNSIYCTNQAAGKELKRAERR